MGSHAIINAIVGGALSAPRHHLVCTAACAQAHTVGFLAFSAGRFNFAGKNGARKQKKINTNLQRVISFKI
jgi:hypothetical protein